MYIVDDQSILIRYPRTIANPTDPGYAGEFCFDANFIYYCVADNSWIRTPIDSWDKQYLFADGTRALTGDWDAGDFNITVSADNKNVQLGAGTDMKVGYDGTDGYVDTSLVAPSDLNLTCGANKTLELQNVVYDDLRITAGSFDRPGTSDPAMVVYAPGGGAVSTYLPEFQVDDIVSFVVQLPHGYKTGQDIKVHVHWTPGANGVTESGNKVGWKVDWTWANIGGAFGAMATADCSDACNGVDHEHNMSPEVTITGSGKSISSMLICNLKRTDTGTDDTWVGAASGQLPMVLEVDFHFPIDTIGSRDWGSK